MQEDLIGLQLSHPRTHGKIYCVDTPPYHYETKKELATDILMVIGFYLIKFILCISLLVDLLAGYFLLVNKFNLDSWQLLHMIVGIYIALAVIFFWETLNGLVE